MCNYLVWKWQVPNQNLAQHNTNLSTGLRNLIMGISGQWASFQIRKMPGCSCDGNGGNVSLPPTSRKPLVSDTGMHHGTCVTHTPWCMAGLLTSGGRQNVPGACAARNCTCLARDPWYIRMRPYHSANLVKLEMQHRHAHHSCCCTMTFVTVVKQLE